MSDHARPLLSVGIPTYNGAKRIEKALNSVLSQDYYRLEILISDNASMDGTRELCEAYERKDRRITYHRQRKNLGILPNFEYLLHVAKGKYFVFLSDDDEFAPGILSACVDFLEQHEDHSLVAGKVNYWRDGELMDCEWGTSLQDESPIRRSINLYKIAKMGGLIHGIFRREMGNQLRIKSILGNDWHFIAGMAFMGKIHQLDQVGYQKSMGGSSSNFHSYVRSMGESFTWAYFPYFKIAIDAFKEILYREKMYQKVSLPFRFGSAILASVSIILHYYFLILPRTWAGKLMRGLNMKTPREKQLELYRSEYFRLQKDSVSA